MSTAHNIARAERHRLFVRAKGVARCAMATYGRGEPERLSRQNRVAHDQVTGAPWFKTPALSSRIVGTVLARTDKNGRGTKG